ncbi:MAG: T9SS type A sorting domain-containing protein [Bacteroidetes bacterium]|nr:T9SS type A sorting domain-containing protein [Bacteroidota bacterium]MBL6943236.1 T9SS type A sorting domain-containing protein [Bacteroidales bacterium]
MKKIVTLTFIFSICSLFIQGQSIELLFTGDNNGNHVTLDSIYIKNLTREGDTMLYAPDSSFTLLFVGLDEFQANTDGAIRLSGNFPNPFIDKTEFNLFVSQGGILDIKVFNLLGKHVAQFQRNIDEGTHHFSFIPGGEQVYILSATSNGLTSKIKLFCTSVEKRACRINYLGNDFKNNELKSSAIVDDFAFELGDKLLMVGYGESIESGMLDSPEESTTYTFQYATNIPCIGTPTVDYEGQIYNTIQILSQCWLKENLNVGNKINSPEVPTNNDTIEKYCMGNAEYYCDIMGGLYYWNEMMQYTITTGGQGICPEGWHIPDDMDWQLLEGAVDSVYKIGNQEWQNNNWRGTDAGGNLKQSGTSLWEPPNNGATDAFGFTALPGGYFVQGEFWGPGYKGYFWSSEYIGKYYRNMDWNQSLINRQPLSGSSGVAFSVRCVKN